MKNRSVPVDIVLPHVVYQNVSEAITWLTEVFGFSEHYRYGEPSEPNGAQMHLGEAWIMLESARAGTGSPKQLGYGTQSLTVFFDDVEENVKAAMRRGWRAEWIDPELNDPMRQIREGLRRHGVIG